MLFYFYGVSISDNQMIGYINSEELNAGFNNEWIPSYQRDRIMRTRKIESLIKIYKEKKPIDAVKLNLIGNVNIEKDEAILDGHFHIIDGQQRLWALKDSNVKDYRMPVELYVNLPIEDEVRLFHQFNSDGTKLTFGELAKSYQGPMADLVRRLLNSKKTMFPTPLSINGSKPGLSLSTFVPIMYLVHRKLLRDTMLLRPASGKLLKTFLQDKSVVKSELDIVEFSLRNLAEDFVQIFGEYDSRAIAYRRSFYIAWNHVVINNFLQKTGRTSYDRFEGKVDTIRTFLKNSHVQDMISAGTDSDIRRLYDELIDYFNHKLKGNRLLRQEEYANPAMSGHRFMDVESEEQTAVL